VKPDPQLPVLFVDFTFVAYESALRCGIEEFAIFDCDRDAINFYVLTLPLIVRR